jgi:hypothetical protein
MKGDAVRNSLPGSTLDLQTRPSSSAPLIGSLLLLGASFALLVLGPSMLARFQDGASSMPAGNYLNIAAASGIALGGGAAMIAVIARLVRDVELRPYAGLAPVLAVFAGFVLWGLRPSLQLGAVAPEHAGVFALALSVAGGALIGQHGIAARLVGWLLAFFAPVALLLMLWSSSGQAQLGNALASFAQPVKVYMMLLGATAFTLCILGEVARSLRLRQRRELMRREEESLDRDVSEPLLLQTPASASTTARASHVADASAAAGRSSSLPPFSPRLAAFSVRSPRDSLRASLDTTDRPRPLPAGYAEANAWQDAPATASLPNAPAVDAAYLLQSQQFQGAAARSSGNAELQTGYTPESVWDYEDEPLTLPKKNYLLRGLLLLVLVAGVGAGLYYGVMLPNQQKEQAVQAQLNERKAQIQAAEEREAVAKQEADDKAAAQRLEKYLNAPAPAAESQEATPSLEGAAAIPPSELPPSTK